MMKEKFLEKIDVLLSEQRRVRRSECPGQTGRYIFQYLVKIVIVQFI